MTGNNFTVAGKGTSSSDIWPHRPTAESWS